MTREECLTKATETVCGNREDEYGTSVISIQIAKAGGFISIKNGKAIVLVVNKWDLIEDKKSDTLSKYQKKLENDVPFLDFVPKIFISALTKQRINSIYKEAENVYVQWKKRVSTSLLNKVLNDAIQMNQPSSIKGKRIRIFYTTQVKDSPPTFVAFVNDSKLLQDHYKRYLEKQLREAFGFFGTPIRFSIREKKGKE